MLYEINDNFDVCAVNFDTIKLILYVIVSKALISQGFLDIEKERKLQYLWYHNFRSYVSTGYERDVISKNPFGLEPM